MHRIIEQPIKRYLEWVHGAPGSPERQWMFYRCEGCKGIVNWKQIAKGGCDCGLSNRIRGARLRWHEKLRLLVAPWMV